MIKVRFLQPRQVRDGRGRVVETFKQGESYVLPPASARHWLERGAAVEVDLVAAAPSELPPEEPVVEEAVDPHAAASDGAAGEGLAATEQGKDAAANSAMPAGKKKPAATKARQTRRGTTAKKGAA